MGQEKASAFFLVSFLALLPGLALAGGVAGSVTSGDRDDFPETLIGHGGPVMGIVTDPDTNRALTASFDYSIILWSLAGESGVIERRLIGHNAAVNDVAFLPGGKRAISVSDDGSAIVWDLQSGRLLKQLQDSADKVLDVAVSPDGRFAAIARWDDTARLIDLAALAEVRRFEGHRGNVNAVAFGGLSDRTLYTASYDGTIRAWDTATGAERSLVRDHGWGVNELLVRDDTMVYGGLDGTLARVDLDTGDEQPLAKADSPVLSLTVSEDGSRIAAGFGDGQILVFATASWERLEEYDNPYGPIWGVAFTDAAGTGLYYSGLDDFAAFWRVQPRKPFEQPQSTFPRRFQVRADMSPGELQFQRKCSVCHTLEADGKNRAGPTLYGLFGRKAGSLPGYPYSEGLRNSNITWNEETIAELFDHGPDVVTPGSKMPLQRLKDPEARDALIAFLKQATMPHRANQPTSQ
jgi:cytochrome c